MIIRRLLAVFVLLFASLGLISAPAAHAQDEEECQPQTAPERGKIPICDTPNGRTFELLDAEGEPAETIEAETGGTIRFRASGYVRDDVTGGQSLTFKLNDIDIIGSEDLDASGETLDGEITLPGIEMFCKYQREYGSEKWWIRVLSGPPTPPPTSIHDGFTLTTELSETACPAPSPSPSASPSSTPTSTSTPTTTSTTSGTTPTTSGTLPKTGIEDHGVLLATGGLGLAAILALMIDRHLRRRRAAEPA